MRVSLNYQPDSLSYRIVVSKAVATYRQTELSIFGELQDQAALFPREARELILLESNVLAIFLINVCRYLTKDSDKLNNESVDWILNLLDDLRDIRQSEESRYRSIFATDYTYIWQKLNDIVYSALKTCIKENGNIYRETFITELSEVLSGQAQFGLFIAHEMAYWMTETVDPINDARPFLSYDDFTVFVDKKTGINLLTLRYELYEQRFNCTAQEWVLKDYTTSPDADVSSSITQLECFDLRIAEVR